MREHVKYLVTSRLVGSTLLIAGCCIGAGMLGLPFDTGVAGFFPSLLFFGLSWLFMCVTGLLLLEVNLFFEEDVSLITMASKTLGIGGKVVAWSGFLFLFYALMVAYLSASGQLLEEFFLEGLGVALPYGVGTLLSALFFASFVYFGVAVVDNCNRVMMAGLVICYLLMLLFGGGYVKTELLFYRNWGASVYILPLMLISFGYHNLVPSLTRYLKHDRKQLRTSIIAGTLLTLGIYLVWEWLILGILPVEGTGGIQETLDTRGLVTQALRGVLGSSWVVVSASYFAFFVLVTSLLAVALSFVDFLADGFHIKKSLKGRFLLTALVFLPPLFFSWVWPRVFIQALTYAGGYATVILYGILPALMVWSLRARGEKSLWGSYALLICVIAFASGVMILETVR